MVTGPVSPDRSSGRVGQEAAQAREIRRGDVFWARIPDAAGEPGGQAYPVLIIQNDLGNRYSNSVIVAAISSRIGKGDFPLNIPLSRGLLTKPAEVRAGQLHTLDKARIGELIGRLPAETMSTIDEAVRLSLGLPRFE